MLINRVQSTVDGFSGLGMDSPSTPDSGGTIRPDVSTYTPLRKTRLYELGESKGLGKAECAPPAQTVNTLGAEEKPTPPGLQREDNRAPVEFRATSIITDENHLAAEHPVLHSTFIPPESPTTLSATTYYRSLGDDLSQLKPSMPTDNYKGIDFGSGQMINLAMTNTLSQPNNLVSSPSGTGGSFSSTSNRTNSTFTPNSTYGKSLDTSITSTPSKMRNSTNSSVELSPGYITNSPSLTRHYHIPHQNKTFEQLAEEQGLRSWNSSTFDNRWTLEPHEMNFDLSGNSRPVLASSSEHPFLNTTSQLLYRQGGPFTASVSSTSPCNTRPPQRYEHWNIEPQRASSSENSDDGGVRLSSSSEQRTPEFNLPGLSHSQSYVPLPPEVGRLDKLVSDVTSAKVTMGAPMCSRITKLYFNDVVFGNREGPESLTEEEASKVTIWNGKVKTLVELRREMLDAIDDLAALYSSPAGQGLRERDDRLRRLSCDGPGQAGPAQYLSNLSIQNFDLGDHIGPHQKPVPSTFGDSANHIFTESQELYDEVSQHTEIPSRLRGGGNDSGRPHLGRLQTSIPATADQARRRPIEELSSQSSSSDISPIRHSAVRNSPLQTLHEQQVDPFTPSSSRSTVNGAVVPQTPSSYEETVYGNQTPVSQVRQGLHDQYSAAQTHNAAFNRNIAFAQMQYLMSQPHQMNHLTQPAPSSYGQQSYQASAGGIYGPNEIFVPHDRFVRPPASNRLAPLFAQSGAWQANKQNSNGTQHPEWQNRFGSPLVQRDNRKLAYIEGSDEMYPQPSFGNGASVRYQNLTRNQPPDYATVTHKDNIPFIETARASNPAQWGVLKLGNIPYDLSKTAVAQFLGTHAKLITPDLGPAVHIIMDRATGKTQDCYVEFYSTPDAIAWEKAIRARGNGINRIGDRLIDVTVSSQDELLKELFPRAKSVVWDGGSPHVQDPQEAYNTGFKTFISAEELQILVRHAEQPQRSNYTIKCQNRPYEAMISLLAKFPWQATELYTLATRNKIFESTIKMIGVLCREIRRNNGPTSTIGNANFYNSLAFKANGGHGNSFLPRGTPGQGYPKALNTTLLRDLLSAALNAPGFSERQRWELYYAVGIDLEIAQGFLISPLLQHWPFEAIGRGRGFEEDVIEWYARLIAGHPAVQALSSHTPVGGPFGNIAGLFGHITENDTMETVGNTEWNTMGRLVAHMCDPQYLAMIGAQQ